jgi:hypothetical protein
MGTADDVPVPVFNPARQDITGRIFFGINCRAQLQPPVLPIQSATSKMFNTESSDCSTPGH